MPDYILEPIETDPDAILDEMQDFIQQYYPNWEPSSAQSPQLDYLILRFLSLKMATTADMASRVMRGIYTYFGSSIVNIQPVQASYAQVSVNWTAIDSVGGRTIPVGTEFGLRDALGDVHLFATNDDATFAIGSPTLLGVTGTALDAGAAANNLSGAVELVAQIDWIASATTAAASSGGVDEEDEETYLNRLTANLGLMAPRPILAKDFALLARNISGIWRAGSIDNWLPGTNEQQTISHNYTGTGATGGTITYSGQTTAALPFNATAAQVQTAFENLNNIEVGDVVVTGGPWPAAMTITFQGNLAYTNVAQITASAGTWTGGTTITINTTVGGVAANAAAERAVAVVGLDIDGNAISSGLKTSLDTYLQSLREANFIVNVIDPAYSTVDVTFVGVKKLGADAADVQTRAVTAVTEFLTSKNWGVPSWPPDSRGFEVQNALRGQELYTILNNVDGLDYISSLTFSKTAGGTQDGADKTLGGIFPVVRPGMISGTVT